MLITVFTSCSISSRLMLEATRYRLSPLILAILSTRGLLESQPLPLAMFQSLLPTRNA